MHGRNLKKILFGHKSATDFSEILHWEAEQHGDSGHVREFKMADGRHIANRKIAISTKNHQILMKFGTQTDLELDDSYVTKWFFKIQDGGRPPY